MLASNHFHDGHFHARFAVFVGAPFFWGPPLYQYPYGYPYYGNYVAANGMLPGRALRQASVYK